MLLRCEFFCSFCGLIVQRDVESAARDSGGTVAYFCSARCGDVHRQGDFNRLTYAIQRQIEDDVASGMSAAQIRDKHNLSIAAVEAFVRSLQPETHGGDVLPPIPTDL